MKRVYVNLKRTVVAIGSDWVRVLVSGVAAVVLWFVLSDKIAEVVVVELTVQERDEAIPQSEQGAGLYIVVPTELAFVGTEPKNVKVTIRGPREEVAKAKEQLKATYRVEPDFTGENVDATRSINVKQEFDWSELRAHRGVEVESTSSLALTIVRRTDYRLTLGKQNLVFNVDPTLTLDGLGEADGTTPPIDDFDVYFVPSDLKVTGTVDDVNLLRANPSLFTLTEISAEAASLAFAKRLVVVAGGGMFKLPAGAIEREDEKRKLTLRVTNPSQDVSVIFERRVRLRSFVLEQMPVGAMIPLGVRRTDVNELRPVSIEDERVTVTVTVSESLVKDDFESAVRQNLNLFVDVGDIPPGIDAKKLVIRCEGAPLGAIVEVSPKETDVNWNVKEAPATGGESPPP